MADADQPRITAIRSLVLAKKPVRLPVPKVVIGTLVARCVRPDARARAQIRGETAVTARSAALFAVVPAPSAAADSQPVGTRASRQ